MSGMSNGLQTNNPLIAQVFRTALWLQALSQAYSTRSISKRVSSSCRTGTSSLAHCTSSRASGTPRECRSRSRQAVPWLRTATSSTSLMPKGTRDSCWGPTQYLQCPRPTASAVGTPESSASIVTARGSSSARRCPSASSAGTKVLRLVRTAQGLSVLVATAGPSGSALLAAWEPDHESRWQITTRLVTLASESLASSGRALDDGVVARFAGATGTDQLDVATPAATSWRPHPPAPGGSATVAFVSGAPIGSYAVNDTVLRNWALRPASRAWKTPKVIDVRIAFGSAQ